MTDTQHQQLMDRLDSLARSICGLGFQLNDITTQLIKLADDQVTLEQITAEKKIDRIIMLTLMSYVCQLFIHQNDGSFVYPEFANIFRRLVIKSGLTQKHLDSFFDGFGDTRFENPLSDVFED